jgi:hypothetical protein
MTGRCDESPLGKMLHRLSRQGSANVNKYQQTSANVINCPQLSANINTHVDFVLEKIFLISSNCQQMSADVSRFFFGQQVSAK